jgi:hypothetical protein
MTIHDYDNTFELAADLAQLAKKLRQRCVPVCVAEFITKLSFAAFAQDTGLLPPGLFNRILETAVRYPDRADHMFQALFAAMRWGGHFGAHEIAAFGSPLFKNNAVLLVDHADLRLLLRNARRDWLRVDPRSFGVWLERALRPPKTALLEAPYTPTDLHEEIVAELLLQPLQAQWANLQTRLRALLDKAQQGTNKSAQTRARHQAEKLYADFVATLEKLRIFDPACGSGQFLHVALHGLLEFEYQLSIDAAALGLPVSFAGVVGLHNILGIDKDQFAVRAARLSLALAYVQWRARHHYPIAPATLGKPLAGIARADALLPRGDKLAQWPPADYIIGRPLFLDDRNLLAHFGYGDAETLRKRFSGRIPGGGNLALYWLEKVRQLFAAGKIQGAGLVLPASVQHPPERLMLEHLSAHARLFAARNPCTWVVGGTPIEAVWACWQSIDSPARPFRLNGAPATQISTDLR